METGSILDGKRSGRPSIDEKTVDAVRVAFHRSLRIFLSNQHNS